MDKMKKMFSKELESDEAEEVVKNNTAELIPEEIIQDTTSSDNDCKTEPSAIGQEINIQPLMNHILKNFNLPTESTPQDMKIKISEDENSLNLSIPKSVKTLLKGFQPLLKTLLNLSEMD